MKYYEREGDIADDFIVRGERGTEFDMRKPMDRNMIRSAHRKWGITDELMAQCSVALAKALERAVEAGHSREIRGVVRCITAMREAGTREEVAHVTDEDKHVTVNVNYERAKEPDSE